MLAAECNILLPLAFRHSLHGITSPRVGCAALQATLCIAAIGLFVYYRLCNRYKKCPTSSNDDNEEEAPVKASASDDILGICRPATDEVKELGGWWPFIKKFSIILKFMWPSGNRNLEMRFIASVILAIVECALNFWKAQQLANFTDYLAAGGGSNPWPPFLWVFLLQLAASKGGIPFLRQTSWIAVQQYRTRNLNTTAHRHIMNLGAFFHSVMSPADKIEALNNASSIPAILDDVFLELVPNLLSLSSATVSLHRRFGPLIILILICLAIFMVLLELKSLPVLGAVTTTSSQRRTDHINAWQTVDNHNRTEDEVSMYNVEQEDCMKHYLKYASNFFLVGGASDWIAIAFKTLALALAAYRIQAGQNTVGDMIALIGLFDLVVFPLEFFIKFFDEKVEWLLNATKLRRIMELPCETTAGTKTLELSGRGCEVQFKNIVFSHKGSDTKTLDALNLHIRAGTKVGIIGGSGSGKSTLAGLIMGDYKVHSGELLIDGHNIMDITRESIHANIARMNQAPHSLHRTVRENVQLGRMEASDQEIIEACSLARIHGVIDGKPLKYDTAMGNDGSPFSGGECQRIYMARLFLQKDARIIVVDEGTSSVDPRIEAVVLENLKKQFKDKTMIFITHKISTLRQLDLIVVLGPGGRIIEQGSHDELMAKRGEYYELTRINEGLEPQPLLVINRPLYLQLLANSPLGICDSLCLYSVSL
ncbi:P-loop containing nucleoside triphosphate hydrolase protein [Stachybotrys elegans]|uniref:P-loop containing nucleoside triphosphate hydrolase protein n=1 Tax=Stachybotrys elegans TaxID=80388 RepID=A0A8K0WK73_9HYPO|nr:P-loop containing nucleoside triphosphate hydrolase protein [Stachybotrys elegans]